MSTPARHILLAALLLCLPIGRLHAEPAAQTIERLVTKGTIHDVQAYLATPGIGVNDRPIPVNPAVADKQLLEDWSLLDFAAFYNKVEIATFLIEHGAKVNAVQRQGLHTGLAPLHLAAAHNSTAVMELLMSHGADTNTRDSIKVVPWYGATPLLFAAANDSLQAAELLLQHGADASAAMWSGRTPLSEALAGGYMDIAKVLISHGARVTSTGPGAARNALLDTARAGSLEGINFAITSGVSAQDINDALKSVMHGTGELTAQADHRYAAFTRRAHHRPRPAAKRRNA